MQGTSIRSLVWEEPHLGSNQACQFSRLVVSDSLWPHGLQHTMLPCLSPTPGACSNSCPLSWWCHPTCTPQLSLYATATELMLQGPRAATAVLLKAWSPRSATREGTAARSPHTAVKSSPHLPQLEKAFTQRERPSTAKNQSIHQSL